MRRTKDRRRTEGRKRDEAPGAPGDLAIIQDLVNTVDRESGTDDLASPSILADWLTSRRLLARSETLGKTELDRALAFRGDLRRLLAANSGGEAADATFQRLDRTVSETRFRLRFSREGSRYDTLSDTFDDALARLLAIVCAAREEGTWRKLKLCGASDCRTAFYDLSSSRTGKWCTRRCGVKLRVRAYRRS